MRRAGGDRLSRATRTFILRMDTRKATGTGTVLCRVK